KTISQKAGTFQSYFASAERAFALLDERPDVPERPHAGRVERATGAVTFRNVSFAYDPAKPVLEDVSFEVPPGARVAVVGATGAERRRDLAGGPSGGRARLHRPPAARLPDAGRRARHATVRRRASAHRAGARIPQGRAALDPRRAHELGRREDRVGDPRSDGSPDAGSHGVPDHTPAERARHL